MLFKPRKPNQRKSLFQIILLTTDRTRDTLPPLAKLTNRIRVEDKITKFVAKWMSLQVVIAYYFGYWIAISFRIYRTP
jgi:uncharacterized membrane protein